MKRRKLVAIVAVVAAIAAFVSTGSAGARVHAADVRGVTDTEIKVAGMGQAANFADSQVGAQARFDEEGDVFGRKITVTEFASDKDDPNTGLSEAKRLVQQEGVFAVLPLMTPNLGQATATFLAQQHVPFMGWGIAEAWCANPYGFAFTGCIVPPASIPSTGSTWGVLLDKFFKANGDPQGGKGKTAAVIVEDNDTGKIGLLEITFQAKKGHFKVVYNKAAIPAAPAVVGDYSPFAADIMATNGGKGPDVVFETVSFSNLFGLEGALRAAGFKGILSNAVAYDPRLVATAVDDTIFTQFDLPEDTSNAKMQSIVAAIKASAGNDVVISQGVLAGYFTADHFVAILKKVGKNLTPEKFAKVASKFTYEIPGIIGPTKFPKAFKQGAPCGTLSQSDATKYNIVVPYDCYANYNYKTGKQQKY